MASGGWLHNESDGVIAEQEPSHWIVPEFVCPQIFATDVHAFPYPTGLEGTVAEQEPSHWIVPEFVCPQIFATEAHAFPYPTGLGGAGRHNESDGAIAEQEPPIKTPEFVYPQAFGADVHGGNKADKSISIPVAART